MEYQNTQNTQEQIQAIISNNPVTIFMKGTLSFPSCRFSALAVQVLKTAGLAASQIHTVNVLDDENIREGIKAFSDWPTIPQIYINQEFIGGSDILVNLYETGELQKYLAPILAAQ